MIHKTSHSTGRPLGEPDISESQHTAWGTPGDLDVIETPNNVRGIPGKPYNYGPEYSVVGTSWDQDASETTSYVEEHDISETQHTAEGSPGYPDAIASAYNARGITSGEPDASGHILLGK